MTVPDHYATVRADENSIQTARVTKTKLGLTWTEFFDQAATTLNPAENGN